MASLPSRLRRRLRTLRHNPDARAVGVVCAIAAASAMLVPFARHHREAAAARPTGAIPVFTACARTRADAETTNLRPVARIDGADDEDVEVGRIPHGVVRLEHVADLVLPDGRLGAGDGFEASEGLTRPVPVARPGTVAPVTLAILQGPRTGRRVAFLEIRIRDTVPATWREDERLGIGTDGGDGGFAASGSPAVPEDLWDAASTASIDAAFPGGDSGSGNACVLRRPPHGRRIDTVIFTTGYGDGGYPTLVGRDARGRIASLVSFGYVLPWRMSGLPGTVVGAKDLHLAD